MTQIDIKHPETVVEVLLVGVLEGLILTGNYVINGPGPAPVAVVIAVVALTAWIIRADYRIIKRDGLYPYIGSETDSASVYGDIDPDRNPRKER